MKINLKETTFLIPLRIDHQDRLDNAHIVLNYLTKNFDTNIILYEDGLKSHWKEFKIEDDKDITYFFVYNEDKLFHRMKIINKMLSLAKTKVVANYDIDCLLDIDIYSKAEKMIIEDGYDFLNPFANDSNLTNGVCYIEIEDKEKIIKSKFIKSPSDIYKKDNLRTSVAGNGFIVFLNRISYLSLGGENEDFLAYGPEDTERFYRFKRLGFKTNNYKKSNGNSFLDLETFCVTKTCDLTKVYHLEHYRSPNSNTNNKHFYHNWCEYKNVFYLDDNKFLLKYLENSRFDLKKYNSFLNKNFDKKLNGFHDFLKNKHKLNFFPRERNFITMSKIGENGRIGNQMFQYSILLILSVKYNYQIKLNLIKTHDKYKKFRLDDLFDINFDKINTNDKIYNEINEIKFSYNKNYDNIFKIKKQTEEFDWKFYLDKYPDLRKNNINNEKLAIQHWNNYGKKNNRLGWKKYYTHSIKIEKSNYFSNWNCMLCDEIFTEGNNLSENDKNKIFQHFKKKHSDKKNIKELMYKDFLKKFNFNWKYYLQVNPDLKINGINNKKLATAHWIKYGMKAGRKGIEDNFESVYIKENKTNCMYYCNFCSLNSVNEKKIINHIKNKHKQSPKIKYYKYIEYENKDIKNVNINGYFQSLKYFKGFERFIRRTFKFKNSILNFCNNFMKKYKKYKTIGIHVRRGDHVYKENEKNYIPPHYTITPKVFENLIEFFEKRKDIKNKKYLIFTENDKERNWCKENFKKMDNIEYVSETKDIHDMCLMTMCDHLVISCSTYSWWGAWLNEKNRIILRPNKWFNQEHPDLKDNIVELFPENWIEYKIDI